MDEIFECGLEPEIPSSKIGIIETDLDDVIRKQDGVVEEKNLTEAISQSTNSFATIKESLHGLLEKLKLNRVETPKKSLDSSKAVLSGHERKQKVTLMDQAETKSPRRSRRRRWSSGTSSQDFDSEDSGFHYDFRNRKYFVDQSGSSEDDISPVEEYSIWNKSTNFRQFSNEVKDHHCHRFKWTQCYCECRNATRSTNVQPSCECDNLVKHHFQSCNAKSKYRVREVLTGKGQIDRD